MIVQANSLDDPSIDVVVEFHSTSRTPALATANCSLATFTQETSDPSPNKFDFLFVDTHHDDSPDVLMHSMSPSALSPRNVMLPRQTRYNQLKDACTQFIDAWILNPKFHDWAMGYLANGIKCVTGGDPHLTQRTLEDLAWDFSTVYGANETANRHNIAPRPAAIAGSNSGSGIQNRLKSGNEWRQGQCKRTPKKGNGGRPISCSFCGSVGHNKTSCPSVTALGRDYTKTPHNVLL